MKVLPFSNIHRLARVLVKALAFTVVIALLYPLVIAYIGLRPPSLRFQLLLAAINFPVAVGVLALFDWLKRSQETWDSAMVRCFRIIMVSLALFFFCLAVYFWFNA